MKKGMYKKLNILFFMVLSFVCAFSLSATASQYEYAVWFDSNTRPVATYQEIKQDGSDTGVVQFATTYYNRVEYGGIEYSSWRSNRLINSVDSTSYTRFHFDFNKADLPAYSGIYNIAFAFCISNGSSITYFPSVYDCTFTNSDGHTKSFFTSNNTTVSGNVCFVRSTVTQPLEGKFSIDVMLAFPVGTDTDASFFNISTVRFTRPFDSGDVVGSIQDSTDQITGAIQDSADQISNEVGDGTIIDNVNNANSGLASNKEVEQNILGSIPDMNNVVKPNYDTNLGDLTSSFSFLGNSVSSFIDSYGSLYNKLWWTLIGLGLFGSICGIVIMITKRKG